MYSLLGCFGIHPSRTQQSHTVGQYKTSLEFKQTGDRVRIAGEFSSLTIAAWVRIDSLDRWYNSLFLTDDYNLGEPQWQILSTGQLFLSVGV